MTPIEYIYTHTGEPMLKAILISLAAGGVATSFAEYFFRYNLVDLVKDKALAVYHAIRGK